MPTSLKPAPLPTLLRGAGLALVALLLLPAALAAGEPALSFAGEKLDQWNGFTRHTFSRRLHRLGGRAEALAAGQALVVVHGVPGRLHPALRGAGAAREGLPPCPHRGRQHLRLPGGGRPLRCLLCRAHRQGPGAQGGVIGISRGGLYAYRWAAGDPARVAVIYGDAPVCDFKSWPGGKGAGTGSAGDWAALPLLPRP